MQSQQITTSIVAGFALIAFAGAVGIKYARG
jgi:hypothetical protein